MFLEHLKLVLNKEKKKQVGIENYYNFLPNNTEYNILFFCPPYPSMMGGYEFIYIKVINYCYVRILFKWKPFGLLNIIV